MKSDYGKKPQAAGFGESRIFRDGDAPDPNERLLTLHVAGTPVAVMAKKLGKAGTDWLQKLSYHQTDEGIAERNAGKSGAAARVISDTFQKELHHKADNLEDAGMEPWEAYDPMKELKEKFALPGERVRFLSPRTIERSGMRGWQPKLNSKGDPVKLGNMIMGVMPEGRARRRDKFFAEKAANELKRQQDRLKEEQERTASELGVKPLDPNASVSGRFVVGMSAAAPEADYPDNPVAQLGLRSVRGNEQL